MNELRLTNERTLSEHSHMSSVYKLREPNRDHHLKQVVAILLVFCPLLQSLAACY
jgi:hypothetical protein